MYDAAIADSVSMVTGREGGLVYVDIDRLKQQPSPEATLFEILQGYGFSSQHAEQVYLNIDAAPGKVYSSGGYDLAIDRGRMLISEKREPCRDLRMPEPGVYVYGDRKERCALTSGRSTRRLQYLGRAAWRVLTRQTSLSRLHSGMCAKATDLCRLA